MAEKEYIEREATYKACEAYFRGVCVYDVSESEVINDFEEVIDAVPTADVAPVRHGHWIECNYGLTFECSECKYPTEYSLTDYCPKCGAKMDGNEVE